MTKQTPKRAAFRTQTVHSAYVGVRTNRPRTLISPRIGRDSNSRYAFTYTHFPDRKAVARPWSFARRAGRKAEIVRVGSPRIYECPRVAAYTSRTRRAEFHGARRLPALLGACVRLLLPIRAFSRQNHKLIRRGQRAVLRELVGARS